MTFYSFQRCAFQLIAVADAACLMKTLFTNYDFLGIFHFRFCFKYMTYLTFSKVNFRKYNDWILSITNIYVSYLLFTNSKIQTIIRIAIQFEFYFWITIRILFVSHSNIRITIEWPLKRIRTFPPHCTFTCHKTVLLKYNYLFNTYTLSNFNYLL